VRTAAGRRIFWRWLAGVVILFGAVALLGSCGVISAMLDTQQGLRNAGYQSVHVGFHNNGGADNVDVSVTVSAEPTQTAAVNVASVVWAKLHERFDNLNVTVHGDGTSVSRQFSFDEMQQTFGARNPSYNSTTVAGGVKQLGFEVLGGLVVIGAIIAAAAILLTRKRRRSRQVAWAGWPPGSTAAGVPGQQPWSGGPAAPYPGGPTPYAQPPGQPPSSALGPPQPGAPGPPEPGAPGPPQSGAPGPPLTSAPVPPPPGRPLWPPPAHPPRPAEPTGPPSTSSPGASPPPDGPPAQEGGPAPPDPW
jgi:hypothetical protein